MFEHHSHGLASSRVFVLRLLRFVSGGMLLAGLALGIGVLGYHWIAGLAWVDALLNASMILGGMGPVDPLPNAAAKVFASFYALFSGLVFISFMGLVMAPVAHRILHAFHHQRGGRPQPQGQPVEPARDETRQP